MSILRSLYVIPPEPPEPPVPRYLIGFIPLAYLMEADSAPFNVTLAYAIKRHFSAPHMENYLGA